MAKILVATHQRRNPCISLDGETFYWLSTPEIPTGNDFAVLRREIAHTESLGINQSGGLRQFSRAQLSGGGFAEPVEVEIAAV